MKEVLSLTLNKKKYQNILFQSRDAIVTMSKFVTHVKREFMQSSLYYISGLNQDIEELFSGLCLFQNRLSATDIKSLKIFIFFFSARERAKFSHTDRYSGRIRQVDLFS